MRAFDKRVTAFIEQIEDAGFEAYFVGGCVRDCLLGRELHDFDITTSALPADIIKIFHDKKVLETGIKHGTVTVLDYKPIEITTFRVDGAYSDSRHPDSVMFTKNLSDDLQRRDFTINAMAFNQRVGLVDAFGGVDDIKNMVIRCVGEPQKRFNEDALRIMRALRFAAVLDFAIEPATATAIHQCKCLLKNIAAERIAVELNKFLCGNCEKNLLEFYDVFAEIIPEVAVCAGFQQYTKFHNRDVLAHIAATITAIRPEKHMRLAMFFHDLGKPECFVFRNGSGHFKGHAFASYDIAERTLKLLKYDNDTTKKVLFLVRNHDIEITDDKIVIKKLLSKFGEQALVDLIDVHIADDSAKNIQNRIPRYQRSKEIIAEIIEKNECCSLKQLDVNGNDLMQAGFSGKDIKIALEVLLDCVIEEKYANNKDVLLKNICAELQDKSLKSGEKEG